jgi:hypothetical protein
MDPEYQISKDKRTKTYLLIIIGVLFVINFFLLYNLISKDKILVTAENKLEETQVEKEQLDKLLDETETLLLEYKGKNTQLDSIIDLKNDEIGRKVSEIRGLLSQKNLTKSQLDVAKREIEKLKLMIARDTAIIDSLSKENIYLRETNTTLADENDQVKAEVENQKTINSSLTDQNKALAEKVKVASRLTATNIKVEGIMTKGSKEKEKSKLSKIDRVKVIFTIAKNEIADAGQKVIYLRLIGPNGSTVFNQTAGSGLFDVKGESLQYTSKATVNFNNVTGSPAVIYFEKIPGMSSGKYRALLYCDEFVMGEGSLTLK